MEHVGYGYDYITLPWHSVNKRKLCSPTNIIIPIHRVNKTGLIKWTQTQLSGMCNTIYTDFLLSLSLSGFVCISQSVLRAKTEPKRHYLFR